MPAFKKLMVIIILLTILSQTTTTSVWASAGDIDGTPYEEAVALLSALNIMVGDAETGDFRLNDAIIRSEFAKIAVMLLGLEDAANTAMYNSVFPDVDANHWAKGYINVAASKGIIVGDDTGTFRPDDTITYAEAITILVRVLGYQPEVKSKGGYPIGYVVIATENGITKNTNASIDEPATRGIVAQLAFNSLTVKIMEQIGFGNTPTYGVVDKSLLCDRLNTQKLSGQVTANENTSLIGTVSLNTDEVMIDSQIYRVGNTNAKDLLGYQVNYYVRDMEDIGEKTIILIRQTPSANYDITIAADDIQNVYNNNASSIVYEYWYDGATGKESHKAYLAGNVKIVFNGKLTDPDETINDLLKPASGKVVLLDSTGDQLYDMVFVTSYKDYVVDEVYLGSHRITDKNGQPSLVLDPDNRNTRFSITQNGNKIVLADLHEWNVLSVAVSKDKNLITIVVSSNTITGKVTEIESDSVYINGKEYKLSPVATLADVIQLGDTKTFYLDIEGKIAAFETNKTTGSHYAYLINAGYNGSIDSRLQFELFIPSGGTLVLNGTSKITLNNISNQNGDQVLNALKQGTNSVTHQLVTYETNSNGDISVINLAVDGTGTGKYNKNIFTENITGLMTYKAASGQLIQLNENHQIVRAVNVATQTLILDISEFKNDPADFSVGNLDLFTDNSTYDVSIFDLSEDFTASVIIVKNVANSEGAKSSLALVDKITTVTNTAGNTVQKLYALQDGKSISLLACDNIILTNLKQGDIIQYQTNAKGEIRHVTQLFDSNHLDIEMTNTPTTDQITVYGRVDRKFTNSINVTVNGSTSINYNIVGVPVYSYDSTKPANRIALATTAEIEKFDEGSPHPTRIFIRLYKFEVKEIVVIK